MTTATALDITAQVQRLIRSGEARRLRVAAGLTMQDAARRCGGVYASALLRWERGERMPRGRNLVAYARLLDRLVALDAQGALAEGDRSPVPAARDG